MRIIEQAPPETTPIAARPSIIFGHQCEMGQIFSVFRRKNVA